MRNFPRHKLCCGAIYLNCSCTTMPWGSWEKNNTAKGRMCVHHASTVVVCVWPMMLSCWWWRGIHVYGQLNCKASRLGCKNMFSTIVQEWCFRLLKAVNDGLLCSCSKLIDYRALSFGAGGCCRGSGGTGSFWALLHVACESIVSSIVHVQCAALCTGKHLSTCGMTRTLGNGQRLLSIG